MKNLIKTIFRARKASPSTSGVNLHLPQSWNDLTRKEILYIAKLYRKGIPEWSFRVQLFLRLTGVKMMHFKWRAGYWFKYRGIKFTLSPGEMLFFVKKTDKFIKDCNLTKQKFPVIRCNRRKYHGPSNSCYNLTFNEFIYTEVHFTKFTTTMDEKHLNQLCAVLYRAKDEKYNPKSPNYKGDIREPFNEHNFTIRAGQFAKAPYTKRYAVYLFYIGFRHNLLQTFPHVFKRSGGSEKTNIAQSMGRLLTQLSNADPTKDDQILNKRVWDIFRFMEDSYHIAQDMKQHQKKGKHAKV